MDIQIWLIPALSLVGGAGGAAIINVIYGIKKQKQDRIDEHARWLRDRKLEAYSDFLRASFSAYERAPLTGPKEESDFKEALQSISLSELSKVRLIAPDDVSKMADGAHSRLRELVMATIGIATDDPDRNDKFVPHMSGAMKALSMFTVTARKDLDGMLK